MNPYRPWVALVLALFAALGFTLFASSPSRAEIKVDAPEVSYSSIGRILTLYNFWLTDGDVFSPNSVGGSVSCYGLAISGDPAQHTKGYITNKDSTIIAFTFAEILDPVLGTKSRHVTLALEGQEQQLLILQDINPRIGRLCSQASDPFDANSVVAYKLVGDRLSLRSGEPGGPQYLVDVQVMPDGQLILLSYRSDKAKS